MPTRATPRSCRDRTRRPCAPELAGARIELRAAESVRATVEKARASAEEARDAADEVRRHLDTVRTLAEGLRREAEVKRESAEGVRRDAASGSEARVRRALREELQVFGELEKTKAEWPVGGRAPEPRSPAKRRRRWGITPV